LGGSERIMGISIISYGKNSLDLRPTWVTTSPREQIEFVSQASTVYHYDLETKQQTMKWRHIGSPSLAPNISECKNLLENSRLDFVGSRRHYPRRLSSKGPNYQWWILLISACVTGGYFERKTSPEGHQGGLVLARQCPCSPGTYNREETDLPGLTIPWSPTLFSGSGPLDYHLFPGLKKQVKIRHFFPDTEVMLPWRPGWTDNLLFF
jgi:hypothetical protein